jgi:BASS family bile acid:Na+ symporter
MALSPPAKEARSRLLDAIALIKLVLMAGIVLTVLSIGLRARPADTLLLLRNRKLGVRAMVSMFVLTPLFVIGLTWAVRLGPADCAALIALSISPMPPILPRRQAIVGGGGDYAVGLSVLAALVSLIVSPIVVWLVGRMSGVTTVFDPDALLRTLAITVLAPLAAGILIARLWPRAAEFSTRVGRVALVLLAVSAAIILFKEGPAVADRIGNGILLVTTAIVLFGLLVGHLLGGPDPGNRGALALATSARHPGVAISLATATFPLDQKAIVATVLLFLLANVVLTLPYVLWRRRLARSALPA